jgi:hypothetical protein
MDCKYKPELLVGVPLGMFHCPECGEMVVAGLPHHKQDHERESLFDKRDELYDAILGPDVDITDEAATAILDTFGITTDSLLTDLREHLVNAIPKANGTARENLEAALKNLDEYIAERSAT